MAVSDILRGLRAIAGVGLVVSLAGLGNAGADEAPVRFDRSEATIMTRQGPVRFEVELALTPRQHEQGLQNRQGLRAYEGMLFVYDEVRPIHMWMKNTLVPLDMIFFAEDGRILNIAERTTPHSLETIPSGRPAKGVLEVLGGTARRFGIRPGDRVVHPLLGGG
jgi:uncharacterized membrane protein (UPF0127 family)